MRPKLTAADRLFWAWLSELWSDWRTALIIVKPETVIVWHRKSFRLFSTWKVRGGNPVRPVVTKEVHDLIRRLSLENPPNGALRGFTASFCRLGIDIGETSAQYFHVRLQFRPQKYGSWVGHLMLYGLPRMARDPDIHAPVIPAGSPPFCASHHCGK
jgi:hypothetical protein